MVAEAPPAPAAAPVDSAPAPATEAPSQETGGGWLGDFATRFFGSGKRAESSSPADRTPSKDDAPAERDDAGATDTSSASANAAPRAGTEPATDAAPAAPSDDPDWKPAQTREEEARRIQSESDRRRAKEEREVEVRQREEAKRLQNAQLTQLERQEEEAVNDGDLDRVRDIRQSRRTIFAQLQQGQFVQSMISGFDTHMLVPLLDPLPQVEQERIVEAIQELDPLPGRKHAVEATLKALEQQWRTDERAKTRSTLKADDAFWREIRAARGQGDDGDDDEPEHIAGTPAGRGRTDPNAALAELIRSRRG
ncbi:MAG TPA: hypothetical protein VNM48_09465 [Chloroflexota bacterium]|nr:hypothetical protein [Chloroflexota bacterium]